MRFYIDDGRGEKHYGAYCLVSKERNINLELNAVTAMTKGMISYESKHNYSKL